MRLRTSPTRWAPPATIASSACLSSSLRSTSTPICLWYCRRNTCRQYAERASAAFESVSILTARSSRIWIFSSSLRAACFSRCCRSNSEAIRGGGRSVNRRDEPTTGLDNPQAAVRKNVSEPLWFGLRKTTDSDAVRSAVQNNRPVVQSSRSRDASQCRDTPPYRSASARFLSPIDNCEAPG